MHTFYSLLFLATVVAPGTATAQKFTGFGLRVGGNLSSMTFGSAGMPAGTGKAASTFESRSLYGLQFGVVGALALGAGHWSVQSALVFSQKGVEENASHTWEEAGGTSVKLTYQGRTRVNYVELPLNFVYTIGQPDKGWQLLAGPYVAAGVDGRDNGYFEYTTSNPADPDSPYTETQKHFQKVEFGNVFTTRTYQTFSLLGGGNGTTTTQNDARVRRFDAGLSTAVGYRRGAWQLQAGYSWGLLNIHPAYPASYNLTDYKLYNRNGYLTATYFLPGSSQ